MKAPVVSGGQSCKELCLASKNEEKQQAELQKRVQYCRGDSNRPLKKPAGPPATATPPKTPLSGARRCYICGSTGHLARECKEQKKESSGKPERLAKALPKANLVVSVDTHETSENALDYLFSSDSEVGGACLIRVHN